jgi:UDPglucose 6-dehydrogenase
MDKRISPHFLNAGLGYGGSCFPKDVKAFINISDSLGVPFNLLKEVERINDMRYLQFLDRIRDRLWVLKDKKIAVWGLAFKQNTDDVRESIAIKLCKKLREEGAIVSATDPKAIETARPILEPLGVHLVDDMYECARDAEVLIIATEWEEFKNANPQKLGEMMRNRIVFDGRNILNPVNARALNFEYHSVGRPDVGQY